MIGPLSERAIEAFLERAIDAGHDPLPAPPFLDLAERWRALGLRAGDLVLLALPTGVALLQHFFAVLAAGGVPALLAPGAPSGRLRETAGAMGARVVAAVRLPPLHDPLVERTEPLGGIETAWLAASAHPTTSEGEVVMLTSGTSGFASGCVTTLDAMLRNAARHADSIGQRADDTVLVSLPLHFSFALVAQALGTLGRGGTLIIAGPPFQPDVYARTIAARGVTVSSLTPIQVRSLLQQGTAFPAGLRVLGVGGDSLAPDHVADLLRRRASDHGELYLTYGLTQAGPRVSTLAAHREPPHRYASVGRPLEGTRVSLADLGDGSGRAELLVSSDTLMRRRIGLVEGRGDDFREPGTLATGDVFTLDEEGYLYHRGRLAEYLVRGGEKVSLATVRRLATGLPGVLAARTRVVSGEGGDDFDLTLVVGATGEGARGGVSGGMRARRVRGGARPWVSEVVDPVGGGGGYK